MLRLVTNEDEPVTPGVATRGGVNVTGSLPAAEPAAAKMNLDCEIELGSVIAATMIEAMMRCGIARPEQAEFLMANIADRYDAIVTDAPVQVRENPEWESFARRCAVSAAMLRAAMLDLAQG